MRKKSKSEIFNTPNLVRLALVAAIYAVMTVLIAPIGYGPIQCRISEILVLLCFYRKDYSISMILGCFIANLFSPFGLYDIIFGTLATAVAVIPMYYVKNICISSLLPVVSNGVIVGIGLYLCGEPLWFSIGSVALCEFIVVSIVGLLFFKFAVERTPLLKIVGSTKEIKNSKIPKETV